MKALPVKLERGIGYVACPIEEATHVTINIPGPSGRLNIPVIHRGKREGTGCWTWNGDTEKPTLRPSVSTTGHNYKCHTWINDGQAIFLPDSTHEHAGKTLDLLEVEGSHKA